MPELTHIGPDSESSFSRNALCYVFVRSVQDTGEEEVSELPEKKVNKDAATGKFVSDKKAKANPKTTYQQTVEQPKTAKQKKKDKKQKKKDKKKK